jgi:hypothetical protein
MPQNDEYKHSMFVNFSIIVRQNSKENRASKRSWQQQQIRAKISLPKARPIILSFYRSII